MSRKNRRKFQTLRVESLEDRLNLAGNVTVALSGNTLTVTGDNASNDIALRQVDSNTMEVAGYQTEIGGLTKLTFKGISATQTDENTYQFDLQNAIHLKMDMKGGQDFVTLGDSNYPTPGFVSTVLSLNVNMGAGSDELTIQNSSVSNGGPVNINLGGDNDSDYLGIYDIAAANSVLTITGGNGDSDVRIRGSFKAITVNGGNGEDSVDLNEVTVSQALNISTGADHDTIALVDVTTNTLKVITAAGDDTVRLLGVTVYSGETLIDLGAGDDLASINATSRYDGDLDEYVVDSATVIGGSLKIVTGAGENGVAINNTNVAGAVTLNGGNESDDFFVGDQDEWWFDDGYDYENYFFDGLGPVAAASLTINSGGGDNYVSIDGAAVNGDTKITAGNGDDSVNVYSSTMNNLTVQLAGGDDSLDLETVTKAGAVPLVKAIIDLAAGDDELYMYGVKAALADVKVGDGTNSVSAVNSSATTLSFTAGNGNDTVSVVNSSATTLTANFGNGDNTVNVNGGSNFGTLNFTAGNGNDTAYVTDSTVGTLTANFGNGTNNVNVNNSSVTGTLKATFGSGVDTVSLNTATVGTIDAKFGGGNDFVNATDSTVTVKLIADGGAGTDSYVNGGGNSGFVPTFVTNFEVGL